eukprot:3705567-Rhodomonas_salina.1
MSQSMDPKSEGGNPPVRGGSSPARGCKISLMEGSGMLSPLPTGSLKKKGRYVGFAEGVFLRVTPLSAPCSATNELQTSKPDGNQTRIAVYVVRVCKMAGSGVRVVLSGKRASRQSAPA